MKIKMGCYINPSNMTKYQFIDTYGTSIPKPKSYQEGMESIPKDNLIVIEIDNGYFTAIGVLFNENEFNMATYPDVMDKRFKKFYSVKISDLWDVCPLSEYRPDLSKIRKGEI